MRIRIGATVALAAVVSLGVVTQASAATKAQYGAKCNAAWTGKRGTHAYRVYKRGCIAASVAAVHAALKAGDNDSASANKSRAVSACRTQFPPPRNTRAKRAAFKACVAAAVASEKAYGGRPLHATLAGDAQSDTDGTGTATFTLNQGHGQICFNVSWMNLGVVSSVDIHAKADDSVVVALDSTASDMTDGNAVGCVNNVAKATIKAIRQNPGNYYVSVLTDEFPTGAIRGFLSK
jgi:hypothetical protein